MENYYLHLLGLVAILFTSGGLGAVAIGMINPEERQLRFKTKTVDIGTVGDFYIGGITSIGVYYFLGALFNFKVDSIETLLQSTEIIKYISIGILSGVAGTNLLTSASKKLERQLDELKDDIHNISISKNELHDKNLEGYVLLNDEKYAEALNIFNDVLIQDSQNELGLIGKAKALRRLNKAQNHDQYLEQAIALLKKAIKNNPSSMRAHYNLACYYQESEKYSEDDVFYELEEALKISNIYIQMAKTDDDLQAIVNSSRFKKLEEEYI